MNIFQLAAAAGLLGVAGGVALANLVLTPRAAQLGTIMAGCGIAMLVIVAVRQLLI